MDREDAERQVREAVEIYKRIFDEMCLAYMINRRPDWDKFAGAVYTIAFDTVLPDGRALQIGTVHYLGTKFTEVFEVTYLAPDGSRRLAHTTSYGISERSIAAMDSEASVGGFDLRDPACGKRAEVWLRLAERY